MLAGFTHRPVVELSERLAALAPPGLGHAFYGSDGASAIEIALKMAFHYWTNAGKPAKTEFVSLAGSYHGETLGRARGDRRATVSRHLRAAPSPECDGALPGRAQRRGRRVGSAMSPNARRERSKRYLAAHHPTTAALIVEPLVQGASGMTMYDAHYLARARELCTRYDVLADRRRDHDRLRPHRHDVRVGAKRGRRRPIFCACRKGLPAATCRCRAC